MPKPPILTDILNESFRISKYATPGTTKSVSVGHGFLSCRRPGRGSEPAELLNGDPSHTVRLHQHADAPDMSHPRRARCQHLGAGFSCRS